MAAEVIPVFLFLTWVLPRESCVLGLNSKDDAFILPINDLLTLDPRTWLLERLRDFWVRSCEALELIVENSKCTIA